MTDRKQAIATLTEHLDHWKRLLSEGICTKDEGEKTINALEFAIESIKVDRAYDLAYEKVDFIEIPEGATNGDMTQTVFPNCEVTPHVRTDTLSTAVSTYGIDVKVFHTDGSYFKLWFTDEWWNSPYRKEQPKQIAFDVGGHTYGVIGGDKIMKEFERKEQE